jgi:DNA modification methylase
MTMIKETKLKIETLPIDDVINYARNSRMHSDAQVRAIAASIGEFGFTSPCLIDADGVLIAGHGRVMALRHLGVETVQVIRLGHLTENQIKALRIADNALPAQATWNADLLRIELKDLSAAGYDMQLLGFDDVQLVSFMSMPSGTDPEKTPEPPVKPVSRLGDVWLMGKHRVICGSSTDAEVVEKVLAGQKPHLMVTDPPYGVEYDPNWRNERGALKADGSRQVGKGAAKALGKVLNDDRSNWLEAWDLFTGDVAYVWHANLYANVVWDSLVASGFVIRSHIIWAKAHIVIGRADYHWQHEPCLYVVRKGKTGHWNGSRKESTRWDLTSDKNDTGHGTQKPIECMRRPIQNNSKPGDYIYEPFAGSGTTVIAAEMMNRYCLAVELSPAYVDVIVQRWMTFAKGEATLEGDGRTFEQVAKARKAGGKNNAPSDNGKPVSGKNGSGNGRKRSVRAKGDAGQPKPGRKPAGKSSAVAGNT